MDLDCDGEIVRFSVGDGIFISGGKGSKHKVSLLSDKVVLVLVEEA